MEVNANRELYVRVVGQKLFLLWFRISLLAILGEEQ